MVDVVLGGPLGVGHHLDVARYSREDEGEVCLSYARAPVWDSPLVAVRLARQGLSCLLLGNRLGGQGDAIDLRQWLEKEGIQLSELGAANPQARAFDVVINSRASSSRTWYSTISPPSIEDISEAWTALVEVEGTVLYLDHFSGDELPTNIPVMFRRHPPAALLYNVGDTRTLEPWPPLLEALSGVPTLLQLSYKGNLEQPELRERLSEMAPQPEHQVVLTRGGGNALFCTGGRVSTIAVTEVLRVATTGAGAYLSAELVTAWRARGLSALDPYEVETAGRRVTEAIREGRLGPEMEF